MEMNLGEFIDGLEILKNYVGRDADLILQNCSQEESDSYHLIHSDAYINDDGYKAVYINFRLNKSACSKEYLEGLKDIGAIKDVN